METNIHTIFFIGKPGCGKGTQAKMLAKETGWQIISSGDQFRAIASEDTPVGHKVRSEMNAGELVPHWFATYIYLKSLFATGADANLIFDGFGRRLPESELIVDALEWLGRPFTVVNLVISDEEVLRRLARRKEIEGRADDNVVEERLKEFHHHTDPAIAMFRDKGVLIDIDGEQSIEAISADLHKALGI